MAAFLAVLHRVREEVPEDLLKPVGVGGRELDAARDHGVDDDALRARGGQNRVDGGIEERRDIDLLDVEAELALHDARHVEQIVDELRLRFRVPMDRFDGLGARRLVGDATAEEPRPSEDRRERRQELVRERREERVLHALRVFEIARPLFDSALEIVDVPTELYLFLRDLAAQPTRFERASNGGRELIGIDRRRHEVVGAQAERGERAIAILHGRDEDDERRRRDRSQALDHLERVSPERDAIAHDDVDFVRATVDRARVTPRQCTDERPRAEAILERLGENAAERRIVVEDEDPRRRSNGRLFSGFRLTDTHRQWGILLGALPSCVARYVPCRDGDADAG